MTVIEFHRAASELLPKGCATEITVWSHRPGEIDPKYAVWSSQHNRHFTGATPEDVLANIRKFLEPEPLVDGDPAVLESLGELPTTEARLAKLESR